MGVVGAGASAGGAILKYMKTKDGKKKGDTEMQEYKETAETNGGIIRALMKGLPNHIIEKMFKSESIPEEEMAWLQDMMKNFLVAEEILKEEKKDLNQEMVISTVIGVREGYHAVKDGHKLVDLIVAGSTGAQASADVAGAAAAVSFGAMKTATATVGSIFLIWDTYNMVVGIHDLVEKKPAAAGELLRRQADDLYPTCNLCDRHTFYEMPPGSPQPELCNCSKNPEDEVAEWEALAKNHPLYPQVCQEARKVVQQKLLLSCKACNQKTATEKGMRSHVFWLHGREKLDEKEQLVKANGHNLTVKTYSKLTYCHHCKKLLWGAYNQVNLTILSQSYPCSSGPALFCLQPGLPRGLHPDAEGVLFRRSCS